MRKAIKIALIVAVVAAVIVVASGVVLYVTLCTGHAHGMC